MTITLYKNTQAAGEKKSDIYSNLWQLFPYKSVSLFHSGFTSEQADYIIPDGYEITELKGKCYLQKANYLYEIFNNPDGNPGIRTINGSIVCKQLWKPGEEPKKDSKQVTQKSKAWVPQMVNGEWEIY